MIPLKLVMTTAGLGRFTAAQTNNGVDLTVTEVGFSADIFVAAPTLTSLPGEFRRVDTVSGEASDENLVHMTVQDNAAIAYTVRGFGLFLGDGTLFATYSQSEAIVEKSASAMLGLVIDIAFPQAGVDRITFGDTNFLNPPATEERKGVVELATLAEAEAGDAARVPAGAVVKAMLTAAIDAVTQAIDGLIARTIYGTGLVKGGGALGSNITLTVDAASSDDVRSGTRADVAVTPAALAAAGVIFVAETRVDGSSRYRRFSDGTVEMSGVSTFPTAEVGFVLNFPWAFPTACEGIFCTTINTAQIKEGLTSIQEVSLAADRATLFAQNHDPPNSESGFRWFARGR